MPAIWNLNNGYNVNNKKVSSKLTFEVGEKFNGRIVNKGQGKEVVVKLSDGWQFAAEIDGEFNPEDQGMVRFEVEGFEDGKLKLKIVRREQGGETLTKDSIGDIVNKEGLSKGDESLLRMMVKHNIPLTKDNITFIKSLTQFNSKINENPEEMDKFIEKFLIGKGVSATSEEGKNIRNMLTEFFSSFKTLSEDDILLFLENNIELNKENIESYNKLFKGDGTIKEYFDDIAKNLTELDVESPEVFKKEIPLENKDIQGKGVENKEYSKVVNNTLASKIYDSNDTSKSKVSMLSLLKSMLGSETELIKEPLKDVLTARVNEFTTSEYNKAMTRLNNLSEDKLFEIIKQSIIGDSEVTKESLNKVLSQFLGKDVEVTEGEFNKFKDILNFKFNDTKISDGANLNKEINVKEPGNNGNYNNEEVVQNKIISEDKVVEGIAKKEGANISNLKEDLTKEVINKEKIILTSKDIIRDDIKAKVESMKDVIKDLIAHTEIKGQGIEKVMELLKGSINDFKLLNSISNEYYYLDIPITQNQQEYPCKLIIKDNRKDGKKIDKTNVKMVVSVKTVNLGTIDGYLSIREKRLDVDLKCDEKFVKPLNMGKSKLVEGLEKIGLSVNVIVTKKAEEVGLTTCRDFFNDHNTRAIDTKV
ncbi:flagellar hook-length control protein FliK [Clostridium paraputrificum]|uniref:flagellar hook-length control protein FliK n=1 Tax=Clostridium TaxID=1485 RepID=UPI003D325832